MDLKPANILLRQEGAKLGAILTDFGISRMIRDSSLKVRAFHPSEIQAMTASYAAPEMFSKYFIPSFAVDVYAFSIILSNLLIVKSRNSKMSQ
jgi:serine/threonine protein kinase